MIAISPEAGFDNRTFSASSHKTKDNNITTRAPEQQKTPKASPVMDKAGVHEQEEPIQSRDTQQQQQQRLLLSNNLLGSSFDAWPYTEDSLIHAINLKSEQEKTKQEYYRLESINRSLELMKHVMLARVPAHMIPIIFAGQNMSPESIDMLVRPNPTVVNEQPPKDQPISQHRASNSSSTTTTRILHESNPFRSHERSQTISTPTELRKHPLDEFSTPPMPTGFRFGGATATTTAPATTSEAPTPSSARQRPPLSSPYISSPLKSPIHQRQLSPAKIGAQAVASLGNNRFRNNLSQQLARHHSRTTSLPPQVSIPEASLMSFHKEERRSPTLPTVSTPTPSNKPVILQHQLIQFHHWTPTEKTETTPNKRRRSDEGSDEKSLTELRDDNMLERRKFITTHTRTRSDTSLMYTADKSKDNPKSSPPKYPNILSDEN